MNMIELLTQMLGKGDLLGQLGGVIGESDGKKVSGGLAAALPSILGSLLGQSSTPAGSDALHRELQKTDDGFLDDLGSVFGSDDNTSSFQEKGSGILGNLLGGQLGSVVDLISKVSGLGGGSSKSLLGMLAPIVMGFLARQVKSKALDAVGLSNLLIDQKQSVAAALPSGMDQALGLKQMGLFDDAASPAATESSSAPESSGSMMKFLIPLLLLAGVAWFISQQLGGGDSPNAADAMKGFEDAADDAVGSVTNNLAKIDLPGFDTEQIGSTFSDLTKSIGGIEDAESAESVLPNLESAGSMVDGLNLGAIADGPARESVLGLFGGLIEKLKAALESAYSIPGVEAVLKPSVDQFLGKFSALGL